MHRIECPTCQHRLKYGDEHAGKRAKCPKCGTSFQLPASPAAERQRPGPAKPRDDLPPGAPDGVQVESAESVKGRSGEAYGETRSILSALNGSFSSDNLMCWYKLSPDGWRVFHSGGALGFWGAVGSMIEGRAAHALDGEPFAPGHGYNPDSFTFSPDSRRYAYAAGVKGGVAVAVDGSVTGAPFDEARDIVWSEDGRSMAFAARKGRSWQVVHDDRPGAAFDKIKPESLAISRDGGTVLYLATRGKQDYVVLGADEFAASGPAGGAISPDGRRRAWVEDTGRGACVVLDGRRGPSFEKVSEDALRFSPDGGRLAYRAKRDGRWHVVVDDQPGPGFVGINAASMTFSPDGRRFAYAACTERSWLGREKWRAVIDGAEDPAYSLVKEIRFSPDGGRVGYVAADPDGARVILDGRPGTGWADVSELTFGPDGRRHVYVATDPASRKRLVIDGREGRAYAELGLLGFTPDGTRVAAQAFGTRHSDPDPGWFGGPKPEGAFLVIDDDYESKAWIGSGPPTQFNPTLFRAIRFGFAGPRSVYAVSLFVNPEQVHFARVDVACP